MRTLTVSYDIPASYNGKRDRFHDVFTLPVQAEGTSASDNERFELMQLAEKADRKLASTAELERLFELSTIVAGQSTGGSEDLHSLVVDAVMSRLSQKGVSSADNEEDGWWVSPDDLSVSFDGDQVTVEAEASWGF